MCVQARPLKSGPGAVGLLTHGATTGQKSCSQVSALLSSDEDGDCMCVYERVCVYLHKREGHRKKQRQKETERNKDKYQRD